MEVFGIAWYGVGLEGWGLGHPARAGAFAS